MILKEKRLLQHLLPSYPKILFAIKFKKCTVKKKNKMENLAFKSNWLS